MHRKGWPGALLILTGALLPLTAVVFHRFDDVMDHQTAHGLTVYPAVLLAAGLIGLHLQVRPRRAAAAGLAVAVLGLAAVVAASVTTARWAPSAVGDWSAYHGGLFAGVDWSVIRGAYQRLREPFLASGSGIPPLITLATLAAEWPGWLLSVAGVAAWAAGAMSSGAVRRSGGFLVLASAPVGIAVFLFAGDRPYAAAWGDVALAVTLGLGLAAVGRGALLQGLAPRPEWRALAVAGGAALALAGLALGLPAGQRFGPLHRHPVRPPGVAAFELAAVCRAAAPGEQAHARGQGTPQKVVEAKIRFASAWPRGSFLGSLPAVGFAWEPAEPELLVDFSASRVEGAGPPGRRGPGIVAGSSDRGVVEAAALRWGEEQQRAGLGVVEQAGPRLAVPRGRGALILMRPPEGQQSLPPPPLERVRLSVAFVDVDGWVIERSADVTC